MKQAFEAATNLVRPIVMRGMLAWERMESGVSFDLASAEVREDPYGLYRDLREKDPVHRLRTLDAWALTRYEDVDAVLRNHHRFTNVDRAMVDTGLKTMLDFDPPDHTRLRSLVFRAFTPRAIAAYRERIQRIADQLLDDVEGQDRFDLIAALAFPLPLLVIAEMVGVEPEDMDRFEAWSNDSAVSVEPILTPDELARVEKARTELFAYFEEVIEQRRREPRDDIVSALLAVEEEDGDRLSHEELLGTLLLILVAGNETTRNLIGNGMLALLRHPDQMQRLREDPKLMKPAIEELLRYDSPVQMDGRVAVEDTELGGRRIRAGQRVIAMIGAANRDPAAFPNPDALDIGRREKTHLSFGRGVHHCLGSSLAQLEGQIAFSALLRRFRSIRLATPPRRRTQVVLRGLRELWIDVERLPTT